MERLKKYIYGALFLCFVMVVFLPKKNERPMLSWMRC